MALAFLSGATGNPAKTKLRVAQQSTLGVPGTTNLRDFRSNSGIAQIDKQSVERLALTVGGAPLAQLAGKAVIGNRSLDMGDVDPADRGMLQMLASLFGKYVVTDNTTWQEWIFGLDSATSAAAYLTFLEDNDVLPRMTLFDALVGGVTLSASPGSNFQAVFDVLVGQYHFFGDGVQTAGAGSTIPTLTRTFDGVWEPTADKDVHVKITDAVDPITVDTKVSAAAAYGAINQPYTLGDNPLRLLDETGARLGKVREQVRFFAPSGATFVLNDEFKFPNRRAAWSASLGTERPIAAVNTQFFWKESGGTIQERRVEGGWNVNLAWEVAEVVQDTSNEQGGTPDRSGDLVATLTPTRRIADLDIQKALHEREELSVVIEAYTEADIGASGRKYRYTMIFPAVRPSGLMFGTQPGGTDKDESPTLIARVPDAAFSYDGNNYASHAHFLVENDVTAL